ncbi:hypothetical protein [Anaeromyxobacter paludicola]|uniref:Uncharacterized protein n=1 Tax=Anaeromyxobacter paludicola TaxID=2918171 RepID=A0ABM7XF81_9BACT|nr:hypothetical protein [Anaeromyxobacter paludicola]BDG10560.1 hypothetical protein AMPC_36730 [Anaeromyxobacter paludicola]
MTSRVGTLVAAPGWGAPERALLAERSRGEAARTPAAWRPRGARRDAGAAAVLLGGWILATAFFVLGVAAPAARLGAPTAAALEGGTPSAPGLACVVNPGAERSLP